MSTYVGTRPGERARNVQGLWRASRAGARSVVGTEAVAAGGAGVEDGGTFVGGPQLEGVVMHLVVAALRALFADGGALLELVFLERGLDDGLFGAQRGGERVVGGGGDDAQVGELCLGVLGAALGALELGALDGGGVVEKVTALGAEYQGTDYGHWCVERAWGTVVMGARWVETR